MTDNIFKKGYFNNNKLIKYGFKEDNDLFKYSKNIINNNFRIDIVISNNNLVGYVYDLETNFEYISYKLENATGEFVSKVRNEYNSLLNDIKIQCFDNKYFISNQSNRITTYIINKYNDKPEFLWDKYPNFGIFRNKNNNKWYGAIMNIKKSIIDNYNNDEEIEIINIKIDPDMINILLNYKGYYKAYHMNKKNWISVILDDTIEDKDIYKLIDISYNLVNKK